MDFSGEALDHALMTELCSGRRFMEAKQEVREKAAKAEALAMRDHNAISAMGKCVLNLPSHEYFLIREKYGHDAFHNKEFIRDFQRLEPGMAVNKV
jgi:hypothetical protein